MEREQTLMHWLKRNVTDRRTDKIFINRYTDPILSVLGISNDTELLSLSDANRHEVMGKVAFWRSTIFMSSARFLLQLITTGNRYLLLFPIIWGAKWYKVIGVYRNSILS